MLRCPDGRAPGGDELRSLVREPFIYRQEFRNSRVQRELPFRERDAFGDALLTGLCMALACRNAGALAFRVVCDVVPSVTLSGSAVVPCVPCPVWFTGNRIRVV